MKNRTATRGRLLGLTVSAFLVAYPLSGAVSAQTPGGAGAERGAPGGAPGAGAMGGDPARAVPGGGAGSTAPAAAQPSEFQQAKDHLEQILSAAKGRDDYARILEDEGYKIASVNDDKPELLEYEVVKGDKTYEVRMRFDKDESVAKKIDVTGNMWKAKETKEMLKQSKAEPGAGVSRTTPSTMPPAMAPASSGDSRSRTAQ
ncbi:MAG: hypothetical protein AB7P21_17175 [Lautropia sp.]